MYTVVLFLIVLHIVQYGRMGNGREGDGGGKEEVGDGEKKGERERIKDSYFAHPFSPIHSSKDTKKKKKT